MLLPTHAHTAWQEGSIKPAEVATTTCWCSAAHMPFDVLLEVSEFDGLTTVCDTARRGMQLLHFILLLHSETPTNSEHTPVLLACACCSRCWCCYLLQAHSHCLALPPVRHGPGPGEGHLLHDVITQEVPLRELEHQPNLHQHTQQQRKPVRRCLKSQW